MADSEFAATLWWQTGVIYQIYPRSFQDTNGDGVGDLPGITARLDYLVGLGIDALWISPIYPSPMADFGYDVADYTGVDRLFGTLADFDALLAAAHGKGLRVILDFVPNHSSDQHPWFLESRSSRDNAKRDWYLWRDAAPPADDWLPASQRLPNNWMSHFGGPAWSWDEATQQFYLHSFLAQQPDLNWRHPQLREAIYAAMRFWLDRGVDGFRMDVLWLLIKDAEFRNNPPNPAYHGGLHDFASTLPLYNSNRPETLQIVAEMRRLLDGYPDALGGEPGVSGTSAGGPPATSAARAPASPSNRVLIGEIYLPLPELVRYYGDSTLPGSDTLTNGLDDGDAAHRAEENAAVQATLAPPANAAPQDNPHLAGANLPFNFHLILTQWSAGSLAEVIRSYESLLPAGAWPNYVLGNHDQPRLASRIGPQQARAAAMLLLTLRGTPTLYYGDELGMQDVAIAPGQVQDPAEKNEPGKGRGRDPERSPMLWVDAPNAGFTTPAATPWLPLLPDWSSLNAAAQQRDPRSMLTLYRHLLALRRRHDTLHSGGITDVAAEGSVLRYRRTALPEGNSTDFMVLLNLGSEPATTPCAPGTVVLTTLLDGEGSRTGDSEAQRTAPVTLEAGEGLLVALD